MSESSADTFRWQTFFQHCTEPLFLLNRRRQVLFANRAWEACTGLSLAEVRGRGCYRRLKATAQNHADALLRACAPPRDMDNQMREIRRHAPGQSHWWEIRFFPLLGERGLLGILGTIRVLAAPVEVPFALPNKLMALRDRQALRYRLEELDDGSPALQRLHDQARLASQTTVPIALLGEAGVGKQWLARVIHQRGDRQRYFACLDAERLPAELLGDVLLGARSRRLGLGVVYLREPGFLPREWQGRLAETIRLHENPEFPRIMVGFRTDPREEVRTGRLLEEFYCTVSTITIQVPSLRERITELPRFIEKFLRRERDFQSHKVQGISTDALAVLKNHAWPNNLRELQEVLRGACHRARAERIELADLPFHLKHGALPPERHLPLDVLLEKVERRLITLAMKLTQNNQTRAAELLEVWRPRLARRLEKFGFGPQESSE